ncbi:MAG TPA: YceI family protein, partial [Thermoanaerobaculia bacterium]|nr:YceI family protein [Thermoanaerobaculia bacterium]
MLRAPLLVLAFGAGNLLRGQNAPADWKLDVAESRLTVKVIPAGLLGSTLHMHFFQPENWSGEIAWDPNHPERVRVGVRIAADSLRDHQPKLSGKDIARVERQVRDAKILDAARFPEILFEAARLDAAELPSGASGEFRGNLSGTLTLHGQSHPLQIPIQGRVTADRLEANAAVTLRQSDFGIKPYKAVLGTVAVKDEITLEIQIVALPADRKA